MSYVKLNLFWLQMTCSYMVLGKAHDSRKRALNTILKALVGQYYQVFIGLDKSFVRSVFSVVAQGSLRTLLAAKTYNNRNAAVRQIKDFLSRRTPLT